MLASCSNCYPCSAPCMQGPHAYSRPSRAGTIASSALQPLRAPQLLACTPLSNTMQRVLPVTRQATKALPVCRALTEIQHDVKETREAIAEVRLCQDSDA